MSLAHSGFELVTKRTRTLGEKEGEYRVKPITAVGTASAKDPAKARLAELVEKLNDLFEGENLTDADKVSLFEHTTRKLTESSDLKRQAKANTQEQFAASPEFEKVLVDSLIHMMDNYSNMGQRILGDEKALAKFAQLLVKPVYEELRARA